MKNAEQLYKLARMAGSIFNKYLDDDKISKGEIFSIVISDLPEIIDLIKHIKDIPAELADLDTDEATQAGFIFHEQIENFADKTDADEIWSSLLFTIPGIKDAAEAIKDTKTSLSDKAGYCFNVISKITTIIDRFHK